MKLFGKGKAGVASTPSAQALQQVDRGQLLGLLDQIVSGGQTAVLTLQDQGGTWVYAFQNGGLVHASGGRVRGARQAFDLLWEFQQGAFQLTPGSQPGLASNLYIDKGRLHELLGRSQTAYASQPVYAPPNQHTYQPQPAAPPYPPAQAWPAQPPAAAPPGWAPAPAVPQPPAPGQPAWGPAPAPVPGYPVPYPGQGAQPAPMPQYPPQPFPPGVQPPQVAGPAYYPQATPPMPPNVVPFPGGQPQPPAPVARPPVPPSFSVPPMPIPRKPDGRQAQPPVAGPVPVALPAVPGVTPQEDLRVLRASLVAQTQAEKAQSATWKVRGSDGAKAAAPAKGKTPKPVQAKKPSKLKAELEERTIKFLLWACERHYSPDDHWTLKDAFEVATMELRDQFMGAFSQSLKGGQGGRGAAADEDDVDQLEAGRRSRQRRRR